ncbi:expressed unknown protein [Seminavis robusta]|uniref:Uncharacterized protein n=1 Tax=Seminavis robusta TaxID=568900 RepID=A0A9N8H6W9_9STRA|nr:expressed unknown protein [Seminavis robusta]|eukprot:Sro112_g055610.1 n/a (635) ;mRNA; f:41309-43213
MALRSLHAYYSDTSTTRPAADRTTVTTMAPSSQFSFNGCFEDPKSPNNGDSSDVDARFCVKTTDKWTPGFPRCSASFEGRQCRRCEIVSEPTCYTDGRFEYKDEEGVLLDCSNIRYGYETVSACQGQTKAYVYVSSGNPYSSGHRSSNRHHHSSSNNKISINLNGDDDDILGAIFFFAILACCVIRFAQRQGTPYLEEPQRRQQRRRRRQRQRNPRTGRMELVELTGVPQQEDEEECLEELPGTSFSFFQPTELDPQTAANLQLFVQCGNWQAIRNFFANIPHNNNNNNNNNSQQRYFWMTVVEAELAKTWSLEEDMMTPWLEEWLEQEPDNVDCRLLRLHIYAAWAWHARPAVRSPQRAAIFLKRLLDAAHEFRQSKPYCRREALFYAAGMTIATGLGSQATANGVSMTDCQTSLQKETSEPLCTTAHCRALQYYSRQWYGSHERMLAYAYDSTMDLAPGHPLWVLIPMAHYECGVEQSSRYWRRAHVRRDISGAYQKAFPHDTTTTTTTTTTTAHEWSLEMTSRNYFLYCFIMTRQFDAAKQLIRVIGRHPTEQPWKTLAAYKRRLRELGFDVSDYFRRPVEAVAAVVVPTSNPVVASHTPTASQVVTIPVVMAEIDHGGSDDLPVVNATIV